MVKAVGYGATFLNRKMKPKAFERAEPGEGDVTLELLYCGICRSDIHQVKNEWKNTVFPCVPGHEIVGRVTHAGSAVTRFKAGDIAAVGCIVDSCGSCYSCQHGEEQYCESETGMLLTYNGPMNPTSQNTYGGYSSHFVIKEHYLLEVPKKLALEVVGPILCAGVTTYSPLKHWGIGPGKKVGVIGLGGLGHMAVQIATAMGAQVTVITTSKEKIEDAKAFGARRVVVSKDKDQMKDAAKSLDFLLNTIPGKHEIEPYLDLLHRDGVMVIVGVLEKEPGWNPQKVLMHRRTIAGSLIGSIAETKEVLDFCAEHGIAPRIELIEPEGINDAFKKVESKEARYRYVINLAPLQKEEADSLDKLDSVSHILDTSKKVLMPEPDVHIGEERHEFKPGWKDESVSAQLS